MLFQESVALLYHLLTRFAVAESGSFWASPCYGKHARSPSTRGKREEPMGNQPKGERNEIRRDQSGSGGSYHQQARR